jgi:hypothetical protein
MLASTVSQALVAAAVVLEVSWRCCCCGYTEGCSAPEQSAGTLLDDLQVSPRQWSRRRVAREELAWSCGGNPGRGERRDASWEGGDQGAGGMCGYGSRPRPVCKLRRYCDARGQVRSGQARPGQGRLSQDCAGWADRGPRALGVDLRRSRDNRWIKCFSAPEGQRVPGEVRGSAQRPADSDDGRGSRLRQSNREVRGRPHAMRACTEQDLMLAHAPPASTGSPQLPKCGEATTGALGVGAWQLAWAQSQASQFLVNRRQRGNAAFSMAGSSYISDINACLFRAALQHGAHEMDCAHTHSSTFSTNATFNFCSISCSSRSIRHPLRHSAVILLVSGPSTSADSLS